MAACAQADEVQCLLRGHRVFFHFSDNGHILKRCQAWNQIIKLEDKADMQPPKLS